MKETVKNKKLAKGALKKSDFAPKTAIAKA